MYFNLKIYTPIDFNILYVYRFFSFFKNFDIKIFEVWKKKKKTGLHLTFFILLYYLGR
jgi:hypothetical protein